jgi:general L-amino acid transport system substrate-binding protein
VKPIAHQRDDPGPHFDFGHCDRAVTRLALLWWICCLAIILSGCSGAAGKDAARLPGGRAQAPASTATPTLDRVRSRNFVQCGVTTGVAGFSTPDAQGEWRGLDVDVCRAIAAAVLGDATKVRFTPLTAAQRFTALQTGEVDVLSRITTITFQRDVQVGIEFPAINWYDGTTFIVRKSSNVKSVRDLDGATICVQPGTTNEVDVADYFRKHELAFTPVVIERLEEVTNAYFAGRCDAFSQDQATLAALRARASNPADHVVLPELISRGPYGPGVMPNDQRWIEIVRWSVYAMVNAEELGLSSATIDRALASEDPTSAGSSAEVTALARCSASMHSGPTELSSKSATTPRAWTDTSSRSGSSGASTGCGKTAA